MKMWKYYDYRIDIHRCPIPPFRLKLIFGHDGLWILEMGETNLINIYINFFYYFSVIRRMWWLHRKKDHCWGLGLVLVPGVRCPEVRPKSHHFSGKKRNAQLIFQISQNTANLDNGLKRWKFSIAMISLFCFFNWKKKQSAWNQILWIQSCWLLHKNTDNYFPYTFLQYV